MSRDVDYNIAKYDKMHYNALEFSFININDRIVSVKHILLSDLDYRWLYRH